MDCAGWGRFAGEGRRWGHGDGWRPIGVIGHWVVWMASVEICVVLGWAALVEFPVCVQVGRDGIGWGCRPRRRLDRWRSRGKVQAFEDLAGDGGVFDGGDQAQRRAAARAEQGVDFEFVNWRGFFAPPGISDAQADRYAELLGALQRTAAWEESRRRNGWQNLYLDRASFVRFLETQERDIRELMLELGFLRAGTT